MVWTESECAILSHVSHTQVALRSGCSREVCDPTPAPTTVASCGPARYVCPSTRTQWSFNFPYLRSNNRYGGLREACISRPLHFWTVPLDHFPILRPSFYYTSHHVNPAVRLYVALHTILVDYLSRVHVHAARTRVWVRVCSGHQTYASSQVRMS